MVSLHEQKEKFMIFLQCPTIEKIIIADIYNFILFTASSKFKKVIAKSSILIKYKYSLIKQNNKPEKNLLILNQKIYEKIHQFGSKSQIIEKLNITEFLDKMRELMKYFEIDFYEPILESIKQYNTPSYEENLFKKRDEYLGSIELRRLVEGGSEDEKNLELKRQESKDVEETFDQLLQLATKAKNNFCACLELAFLYGKESLYYYTIGIVYKNIKVYIKINRYSKNIHKFLMDKLRSLFEILTGYYIYNPQIIL